MIVASATWGHATPRGDVIEQTLGQARERCQTNALVIELHRDELPATVNFADDIFFRNTHIVVVRRGCHHAANSHDRSPFEAWRVGRNNDQGDALVLGRFGVGATGQPDVVRLVGTRGVDLVAVDDPFIAIEYR